MRAAPIGTTALTSSSAPLRMPALGKVDASQRSSSPATCQKGLAPAARAPRAPCFTPARPVRHGRRLRETKRLRHTGDRRRGRDALHEGCGLSRTNLPAVVAGLPGRLLHAPLHDDLRAGPHHLRACSDARGAGVLSHRRGSPGPECSTLPRRLRRWIRLPAGLWVYVLEWVLVLHAASLRPRR